MKDIKRFSIKRAIEEIVQIQQYQAESKGIVIQTDFIGFPPRNNDKIFKRGQLIDVADQNLLIESDEKRFKQVLMNL